MDINYTVRWASAQDMSRVLNLIKELAIYEHAEKEVITTVDQLMRDGFGERPAFKCFVAENKLEVVGFALFYMSYSTWKGKCTYLEDLLVTETHRRTGCGKLLFEAVLEEAKKNGSKRMEWQVLDWNEPAINFYKKYQADLNHEWINGKLFL